MLLAWSSNLAFAGLLLACIPYGAGRHQWDVSLSAYYEIQFLLFIDFVIYDLAITGAKISILLQLRAIFCSNATQRNRFYWSIVALILINLGFYLALSLALIFQCQPIARGWQPDIPGTCLDQETLLASSGPFNIVSDFLIFLLPIYAIWQLHLPIKKRLEVCCAFAVGLFGCICSAVRLVYSERLKVSADATTLIFENQLWAEAEITAGILIANAMILPRFIRHLRGKRDTSFSYDYARDTGGDHTTGVTGKTKSHRASKRASAWPGSPRASRGPGMARVRGMGSAPDPWIELKDSDSRGPSTVVSGSTRADGDADSLESLERPYGGSRLHAAPSLGMGIVKTVQIETRSELVGSAASERGQAFGLETGSQVAFEEPRVTGASR